MGDWIYINITSYKKTPKNLRLSFLYSVHTKCYMRPSDVCFIFSWKRIPCICLWVSVRWEPVWKSQYNGPHIAGTKLYTYVLRELINLRFQHIVMQASIVELNPENVTWTKILTNGFMDRVFFPRSSIPVPPLGGGCYRDHILNRNSIGIKTLWQAWIFINP